MESNEETSKTPVVPVVHKFGDEDLSDVTFLVGGEQFLCHKMNLASRSSYFKAMFFSDFKEKNQKEVTLDADPVAFSQLMEIIYTGHINNWKELLSCRVGFFNNTIADAKAAWVKCNALLKLADQLDLLKTTVTVLENCLLRSNDYGDQSDKSGCGVMLIIAVMYGMEDYKKMSTATKNAVVSAMNVIKEAQPILALDPMHFQWLLNR